MDDRKTELRRELLRRELASREPSQKPSMLMNAANEVDRNIIQPVESLGRSARDVAGGFGQGLANIFPGAYNLGASGVNALGGNVQKSPMIDVVPHSASATAGEMASFFAPGSILKLLGKAPAFLHTTRAAMKIPLIAEGIKHASNVLSKSPIASKVAGNALLGGVYTPENPLAGMGLGAAGGAIGEGVGKLAKDIHNSPKVTQGIAKTYNDTKNAITSSKLYQKINPAAHMKEIEHNLSHGSNNITSNSRQLATDIRNAHDMRNEESSAFFNYALDKAGNQKIYPEHQMMLNKMDESQKTMSQIKDVKAGDLFGIFKSNPTFQNAHNLQSELGSMERTLKSNPQKTIDDKLQISKINSAREQLNSDISSFLEKHDESSNAQIAKQYHKGSELFRENVVPYLSHEKLLDINKARKTDVKDLHNVFGTPSNTVSKEGVEKIGAINKIMHDLPASSKERILFNAIGGNKLTPKALLQKLDEIKSKGFESYFTPELEASINALSKKVQNRSKVNKIAKYGSPSALAAFGGYEYGKN